MKLTSLFHLTLITLSVGISADLTAASTVQPSSQSSSASAQAEAKEARAKQNASASNEQPPLRLKFQILNDSLNPETCTFTFEQEESFYLLAHLLQTNIQGLQKLATQSELIQVLPTVYDAITIVAITERERPENIKETILKLNLSFEGAMAWYTAYMQIVSKKEGTCLKIPCEQGAIEACREMLINRFSLKYSHLDGTSNTDDYIIDCKSVKMDEIVEFLLKNNKLSTIEITARTYGLGFSENSKLNAAEYLFMNIDHIYTSRAPGYRFSYGKLATAYLQIAAKNPNPTEIKKAQAVIEERKKQWAEESEKEKQAQTKSASAVEQQSIAPANIDNSQANPAPAAPQPRNVSTKAKNFFCAHSWAKYTVYALAGAAAIYGGYRLYKHVNMRKLARYAGNWA